MDRLLRIEYLVCFSCNAKFVSLISADFYLRYSSSPKISLGLLTFNRWIMKTNFSLLFFMKRQKNYSDGELVSPSLFYPLKFDFYIIGSS